MSAAGQAMATAARGFVGTPFKHKGRTPGIGLDCAGVAVCAAWAAGLAVRDFLDYGPHPDPQGLLTHLAERAESHDYGDVIAGDLVVFAYRRDQPAHFAVHCGETMVHAYEPTGRVIEHRMSPSWRNRLHSVWRFGGVE